MRYQLSLVPCPKYRFMQGSIFFKPVPSSVVLWRVPPPECCPGPSPGHFQRGEQGHTAEKRWITTDGYLTGVPWGRQKGRHIQQAEGAFPGVRCESKDGRVQSNRAQVFCNQISSQTYHVYWAIKTNFEGFLYNPRGMFLFSFYFFPPEWKMLLPVFPFIFLRLDCLSPPLK